MPIVEQLADDLANESLKNVDLAVRPSAWWAALFSAAPSADGSGGTELAAANGYARQAITWGAVSGGGVTNSAIITFTASGAPWTEATHFVIFSLVTAGVRYFWNALDAGVTVGDGESAEFAAGALEVDFLPGVA
jgi:hypothetical protein